MENVKQEKKGIYNNKSVLTYLPRKDLMSSYDAALLLDLELGDGSSAGITQHQMLESNNYKVRLPTCFARKHLKGI